MTDTFAERQVLLTTAPELWHRALEQLRLLVPDATFDSLFAGSSGETGQGGMLMVNVATPQAVAWIQARLADPVQSALRAAGYQGQVQFRHQPPATPPPAESVPHLPTPGPAKLKAGDVAFTFLNFDLYARGWLRTPTYYELFWQPILGYIAYAYWRQTQTLYWGNASTNHTRRARLDIQDSAAYLGVSRDLIRGKPAQGLGGALKTLDDFGLAEVERHAAGRATVYTGRFRRRLPLLTPAQAAQLTQSQQQDHLDWLLAAGFNPAIWEALGEQYETFVLPAGELADASPELQQFINPNWELDHLSQAGFLRTPVYYDLYLQPLIGPVAYAIWRVCKCLHWSEVGQTYTRDTLTSVYALAATLNCNRQMITGVRRRKDGVAYWQDGAFDRLRQERLAIVREEGSGSQTAYRLLVINEPPLLCPTQVEKFPAKLQESHDNWLNKAKLQLEQWEQLSLDSLLALVD